MSADKDEPLDDLEELAASLADTGSDESVAAVQQIAVAEGFDQ